MRIRTYFLTIGLILLSGFVGCKSKQNEDILDEAAENISEKNEEESQENFEEDPEENPEGEVEVSEGFWAVSLGSPSAENMKTITGYNPADLIIEDGVVYIGAGDYSANTGPTTIWGYDIENTQWFQSARVAEQAIQRFVRIGDQVMAPGIDAVQGWELGNYYVLDNRDWKQLRKIPHALHVYDIVKYREGLFAGIGVNVDLISSPVQVSWDNGETFVAVPFYKDGQDLFNNIDYERNRVYEFFLLGDVLYCYNEAERKSGEVSKAVYKYENNGFYFVTNMDLTIGDSASSQNVIYSDVSYRGNCYFTNGLLRKTADFGEVTSLYVPNRDAVVDLLVANNDKTGEEELYLLSTRKIGFKNNRIIIWKYADDENYEQICSFKGRTDAVCFDKYGDDFFVGTSFGEVYYLKAESVG